MQKKILVVAESINVEDSSGSKANVALIRNLNRLGYNLKVFHYTRREIKLDGIECIAIKEKRRSGLFFLSRIERYFRYLTKLEVNKPLEKVFGFSFTLFNDRNSIIKKLKKDVEWNADLVLTLSKGGSFRPHHAILRLSEYQDKWMAYIHDPYPMHFYPPPYPWYEPGHEQKESFMKEVALKSAILAFPSELLMDWMGRHFSPFKEKGIVIPHQLETNEEDDTKTFPDYFRSENFNLVHAGNLIQGREPFGLIQGFRKFLDETPEAREDARLIFLGGPSYYSKELHSNSDEIPQFILSGNSLPFSQVQFLQKNSSVNIILEAKSEISPFLPGKFPHCIRAKKMILLLGPPRSESRRLLGMDYEFWSEIDDVDAISNHIQTLYLKWKNDLGSLHMHRKDLEDYLSLEYLQTVMEIAFNRVESNISRT